MRFWLSLLVVGAFAVALPSPASAGSCSGLVRTLGLCVPTPSAPSIGGQQPSTQATTCSWLSAMFGCKPSSGSPTPAPPTVFPDGSVNPGVTTLQPLPAPVPGQPLYPRTDGKIPYGMNRALVPEPEKAAGIETGMGGSVHRISVSWPGIQSAKGTFWWGEIDAFYKALVQAGVRPILVIYRTPREYVDSKNRVVAVCGGNILQPGRSCDTAPAYEHVNKLGEFARRVAVRYPLAAGIELWNEPNLTNWWKGIPPDGTRYTGMLRAVWNAVKRPAKADGTGGRPAMRILGGSINNKPYSSKQGLEDRYFLDQMLAAGAADVMDGLAIHPYPHEPSLETLYYNLGRYEDIIAKYPSAAGLRYAVTEIGFTTGPSEPSSIQLTREQQADALVRVYDLLNTPPADLRGGWRTDLVVFHTTVDRGEEGFGLLTARDEVNKYEAKPAWCAIRREVGQLTSPLPDEVIVPPDLAGSC